MAQICSQAVQFVVKTSKYCNLRCDYCYEFADLGKKERIGSEALGSLFANVQQSAASLGINDVTFFWHGGEPLLVPLSFYDEAGQRQREIFDEAVEITNVLQTNLTVLTPRHLEFLKDGTFFSSIGVSFDPYGEQRVDTQGRLRTETVVRNMRTLLENGVEFGAISVLARSSLPYVRQTYRFFDALGISFRILPYYMTASTAQARKHGITHFEEVQALKGVFLEWLASETATPVDPIEDYLHYAVLHRAATDLFRFDRSTSERVFIVDVDGSVYGLPEAYEPAFRYGNIFEDSFADILHSEGRQLSVLRSAERALQFCHQCPYFGRCVGEYVANATREMERMLDEGGCPVRATIDFILDVFDRTGLAELVARPLARPSYS